MKKALVFCSQGLGDGLIFLNVAENLKQNGFIVEAYHPFLAELQAFFALTIKPYPSLEDLEKALLEVEWVVINSDSSLENQKVVALAKKLKKEKCLVLHATTCKGNKASLPGDYYLDPKNSLVENLKTFCQEKLKLPEVSNRNGFFFLQEKENLEKKLVVIHALSKDPEKNWPLKKFLNLARKLQKKGFEIAFISSEKERTELIEPLLKKGFDLPFFSSLEEMFFFLAKASFFIGNDSGLGHLASLLKIPTLTIFSTRRKEKFWRPVWGLGKTVCPFLLLPNFKFFRLQERFWKKLLPVFLVYKRFLSLVKMKEGIEK